MHLHQVTHPSETPRELFKKYHLEVQNSTLINLWKVQNNVCVYLYKSCKRVSIICDDVLNEFVKAMNCHQILQLAKEKSIIHILRQILYAYGYVGQIEK